MNAGGAGFREIAIVGLGLIGSSIARAVRAADPGVRLVAVDASAAGAAAARAAGLVDAIAPDTATAAATADLLVLAVPVRALPEALRTLLPLHDALLARGALVTDVGSTKASLLAAAVELFGTAPAWLVPGHPLAGSERSGWTAGRADLFAGRKVLLCPTAANAAGLGRVAQLWRAVGATVEAMDAAEHDGLLAQTSHLPHLLSYALVEALIDVTPAARLFGHSGGGFRDMTRLAASDPVMWRDIALDNRDGLLRAIDTFSARLAAVRADIAAGDGVALQRRFMRAKAARDEHLPPSEGPAP
jgi:prephenate dehydrogenase